MIYIGRFRKSNKRKSYTEIMMNGSSIAFSMHIFVYYVSITWQIFELFQTTDNIYIH